MTWDSAHRELDRISKEHNMLFLTGRGEIDTGDFVRNRKAFCFYPDPAIVPKEKRRAAQDKFERAVRALRIRPRFQKPEPDTEHPVPLPLPHSAQVSGFCFYAGLSENQLEVISTASYGTARRALQAWKKDTAEWSGTATKTSKAA